MRVKSISRDVQEAIHVIVKQRSSNDADSKELKTLRRSIIQRLAFHLRKIGFVRTTDNRLVAPEPDKSVFRDLHRDQRNAKLASEREFIEKHWPNLSVYFANGDDVNVPLIRPRIELVLGNTWQSNLFRLASCYWSVPVSQGYGRRMRFLVWDDSNGKLIGIFALGDPVFNLKARDELIGWTAKDRKKRLVSIMDAYVLGAVPPYNQLLGGKLVASLIRSKEVRRAFRNKYRTSKGVISRQRKSPRLVAVTTSSALGRSSLYNRLKLEGHTYFEKIGETTGWGHFHVPDHLFRDMRRYLELIDHDYSGNHAFGQGPNWKLRAIKTVLSKIGWHPALMVHGIKREIYLCSFVSNLSSYLKGASKEPRYHRVKSVEEISRLALERWITPRSERRKEYKAWKCEMFIESLIEQKN